jgi:hypothetical protein
MQGLTVFRSLSEAIHYGFEPYDRTEGGYLVRIRTGRGFAFALVIER